MKLIETARQTPTWIVTAPAPNPRRRRALEERGAIVIEVESDACCHPAPGAVAAVLAKRGVTRVLIEGGGGIAASYLTAGMIDRLAWFRAPQVIGGEGVPAVGDLAITSLSDAPRFSWLGVTQVGKDVLETYRRRH
jgi:diaminohydroxyphosphoribosylaminopyrimidine deaminase/5-amino-6-(5-phosphoribosylamino)uracil reductase